MSVDILINARNYETRLALVEHGVLSEFHIQRPTEKGMTGNLYKGKIVRVLPGMQAAFVDIGLERTGFLYVDDVYVADAGQFPDPSDESPPVHTSDPEQESDTPPKRGPQFRIEQLLTEGQTVLAQINKEPIGTKGARLTCHITLPCRNLVFLPLTDHVGISRKIEDEAIREQLREKIMAIRPQGSGFIVRTVAESASLEELEADMEFLLNLWEDVRQRVETVAAPSLIYEDLDITLRSVRDLFTPDVDRLIVDSPQAHAKIVAFARTFAPALLKRLALYQGETPLFEAHGIESEISRAIEKKVWLRSGGYIIIESTEALSVIDVNTGRYVGKCNLSETIFKTNMEAAVEIAYQLRLRNIGGIIIIDFIDMEEEEQRETLYAAFKEAMKRDKSRINILKLSEFGLVQMTRKRNSESLYQLMCEPCLYCRGEGMLKSRRTICYEIFRKIDRNAKSVGGNTVTVRAHPDIAEMLSGEAEAPLLQLGRDIGKRIIVAAAKDLHIEKYEIIWQR
ncbi:MAG: Rne/Rng family ribonuclease [Desulfobulbaceae bacterium]|jgi:ribonuclease G|nr:Rne/Rng family ribonuclease [Desulfobulbaceae bacterium]